MVGHKVQKREMIIGNQGGLSLVAFALKALLPFLSILIAQADEQPSCVPNRVPPLRVAVIGAGPGGLFFCHAVEKIIQQQEMSDCREIQVTAFERSSQPGGLWQNSDKDSQISIYDNLWTNGASFLHEFYDYPYADHFEGPVDVYMRREDLLGYILGRVQKNSTNFFEKYIQFNTEVVHVHYDETKKLFEVEVKDVKTGAVTKSMFEKCVWAGGGQGKPKIPDGLVEQLKRDGYKGRLIHSSDMAEFDKDVQGKRILLIGGGRSAEDLALQAIKCGVEKVYCATRDSEGGDMADTTFWPSDKVELMKGIELAGLSEDGQALILKAVKKKWPSGYERDEKGNSTRLENIDTIIFCTGYTKNLHMLEEPLGLGGAAEEIEGFEISDDWEMENNFLTPWLGDVKPGEIKTSHVVDPREYDGVLVSNPNMFFMGGDSDWPLLSLDVYAHLFAGYVCGTLDLPTGAVMKDELYEYTMSAMQFSDWRYYMDYSYFQAYTKLLREIGTKKKQPFWDEINCRYIKGEYVTFSELCEQAKYPLRLVGTESLKCPSNYSAALNIDGFTETGQLFHEMIEYSEAHRAKKPEEKKELLTFRDYIDGTKFRSLFNSAISARESLEDQWMNL